MKKVNRSLKVIVDTNIWISFLIGKSLKGLQVCIVDIPVMLTPSPVMLTPIKDDGLREL